MSLINPQRVFCVCLFCSISLCYKENTHLTDSATPEACCVKETPMQVIVFLFFVFLLRLEYQITAFISSYLINTGLMNFSYYSGGSYTNECRGWRHGEQRDQCSK